MSEEEQDILFEEELWMRRLAAERPTSEPGVTEDEHGTLTEKEQGILFEEELWMRRLAGSARGCARARS